MTASQPRVRAGFVDPQLRAPQPGWFVPSVGDGDLVTPETELGRLVVLGRPILVLAAKDARGHVASAGAPRSVGFGDVLCTLQQAAATAGEPPPAAAADARVAGSDRVFRAPTSGRFYGRPGPDKPAFVAAGAELAPGATVCLLEVMKTFHRVTYGEAPARVRAVLVADGDDVNAGDPLLALE